MILRNGGTVNLDTVSTWNEPAGGLLDIPGSYGQPALDMLEFCGRRPGQLPGLERCRASRASFGLRAMLLFPAKDWGAGPRRPEPCRRPSRWPDLPRAHAVRRRGARGHHRASRPTTSTDWISRKHGPETDQEKKAILLAGSPTASSCMKYVGRDRAGDHPVSAARPRPARAGAQAVSAGDMWALGQPRLRRPHPRLRRHLPRHRPHAAVRAAARLREPEPHLARRQRLAGAPARRQAHPRLHRRRRRRPARPGEPSSRPKADYTKLDRPGNSVRIRLNSLVFRVKPGKAPRATAKVDYLARRRRHPGVEARHVVMACWNRVTAHIVEGLPRQAGRGPLLRPQGAADLRSRRPQQLAGVRRRQDRQRQPARQQPVLGHARRCRPARASAPRYGPTPEPAAERARARSTSTVVATDHRRHAATRGL